VRFEKEDIGGEGRPGEDVKRMLAELEALSREEARKRGAGDGS
jgi:hypothetical protein